MPRFESGCRLQLQRMKAPEILPGHGEAVGPERDPKLDRGREHGRALGITLLLGAVGALPSLSGDGLVLLFWLGLVALPLGVLFGSARLDLLRFGLVAPACWMIALTWVEARAGAPLPSPLWGALAWSGLFLAGAAWGRAAPRRRWSRAAGALLLAGLLAALPVRAGLPGVPWSPAVATRLLDLSPVTLLAECSGVRDWMWRAGVYEQAGVDRFLRTPWRGELAGPVLLLVGWALSAVGTALCRARIRTPVDG